LNATQRHNLGLNGQDILDNLADLRAVLVDRYERWRQDHPDGVDEDITPNVRTQQLANDNAARAQQQLPGTDDPYEKLRQENLDGVDEDITPNVSTQ